jgi:uncharacterized protein YodC (DUF2158 family)
MRRAFSRGQWIRLTSGGPIMMIVDILDQNAYCMWVDGGKRRGARFPLSDLTPVPSPHAPMKIAPYSAVARRPSPRPRLLQMKIEK